MRIIKFYLNCLLLLLLSSSSRRPPPLVVLLLSSSSSSRCPPRLVVLLVLLLNCDSRSTVFVAGPQPRPSTPSVPCRTSTTTIHAQCSLPDLNHGHPRPVVPAGPQPRISTASASRCPPRPPAQLRLAIHSVRCRTSTTTIHTQCSLPDLNHNHPRPMFPAGPQPRPSTPSGPCRTSTANIHGKCSLPDLHCWTSIWDLPSSVCTAGPQRRNRLPENMPDRMPENIPDRMPEDMPDRMPDNMSEHMAENMPDRISDRIPEGMPEKMP